MAAGDPGAIAKMALDIRDAMGKTLEDLKPAMMDKYKMDANSVNIAVGMASIQLAVINHTSHLQMPQDAQNQLTASLHRVLTSETSRWRNQK